METQLLRTFLAVAETGSISAASVELGYVQSSVSQQVNRLESELGCRLLVRSSTGVHPTPQGQKLIPEAQRALAAIGQMQRNIHATPQLRIGAVDTLAVQWLPRVSPYAAEAQRPKILMDRRDRLLVALIDGGCDLAILYRAPGASLPALARPYQAALRHLTIQRLDHDELCVVSAPDAQRASAAWLVTQPGCVHREAFDHLVARHAEPPIRAEAATPEGVRQLARQGAGRALLPKLSVVEDLAAGALTVDDTFPLHGASMEIVAVHHEDPDSAVLSLLSRAASLSMS